MIQENEMRIGNWIQNNSGSKEQIEYGYEIDKTYLDYLYPIPLTPEILEKCGFQKDYDGYFTLNIGRKYFSIGIGDQETFVYQPDIGLKAVELNCDCEYLHQFQNLFFCLVGQELEIKKL